MKLNGYWLYNCKEHEDGNGYHATLCHDKDAIAEVDRVFGGTAQQQCIKMDRKANSMMACAGAEGLVKAINNRGHLDICFLSRDKVEENNQYLDNPMLPVLVLAEIIRELDSLERAYNSLKAEAEKELSKHGLYLAVGLCGACMFDHTNYKNSEVVSSLFKKKIFDSEDAEKKARVAIAMAGKGEKLQALMYFPYRMNYKFELSLSDFYALYTH